MQRSIDWPVRLARMYRRYFNTIDVQGLLPDGRPVSPREYVYDSLIFAHKEREILSLAGILSFSQFAVLIARGRDGDWMARAVEACGSIAIRGSTLHHGSRALIRLIRTLNTHRGPAAISVDGPLGPADRVQQGVISCALHTGRPIVPLGVAVNRKLTFPRTWSGIFLPLPFSQMVIACGEPLEVEPQAKRADFENAVNELSTRLQRERQRAETALQKSQAKTRKTAP